MCEPTTIALVAMTALSAGAGLYSQQQQVKAQEAANQTQYNNTMAAYRGNLANIEVQRNQAAAQASEQINLNNKAAMKAESTATTAAGESGVSGTSVDALLRDLGGQAGYDNTNVEANYLNENYALNVKRENAYSAAASQINSLQTPTMPNYLGAALRIGTSVAGAYAQQNQTDKILAGLKPYGSGVPYQ